jgi:thioredoxin reductase (NADPH)
MATVLAEDTALGGQAGTSSRIENYLGFPAGLSGEELAARAALQAQKFGVRIKLASKAVSLSSDSGVHQVRFDDGDAVSAKSVIIATGARYNRLPLGGRHAPPRTLAVRRSLRPALSADHAKLVCHIPPTQSPQPCRRAA